MRETGFAGNERAKAPRRPTLLVLTSSFPRWEHDHLPSFVLELSRRLTHSFNVVVLAPHCQGAKRREIWGGMDIHRFVYWVGSQDLFTGAAILPTLRKKPWLWLAVPLFLLSQLIAMARIMKAERVEVIHAHWILPQGLLAVLCKSLLGSRARLLVTSHGGDIFGLKPLGWLKRFVLDRCDAVTVVSNAIREEVLKLGCTAIPIDVVPMGVDMERFHPERRDEILRWELAPNGPLILFVGRLSEKKGLRYLLDAMPDVMRRFPESTLLVIGEGEDREALEAHAHGLGLAMDRVVFYGGVANRELPRFYATADIFVGPSVTAAGGDAEGFGLVFVEALACSCPVIATDLPAIEDIVKSEENGLIVKQRSSSAIAEALLDLLGNLSLMGRMKIEARKSVVDRYDWTVTSGRYADLLGKDVRANYRPAAREPSAEK